MTTAARPTFEPARGGGGKGEGDLSALSKQYSARDLPSHTKIKYRQEGQNAAHELRNRDFRKDLEDRERAARDKRDRGNRESGSSSSKKPRIEQIPAANLDADDPVDQDEDSDSDNDSDEDDAADLVAELQKIRRERAQDAAKKEAERKIEEERIRSENIIKGNPLIHGQDKADFKVKRRWDDDVVFKNCSRGESDRSQKRFINDTLRSDFHRKFMEKYVK